MYDSYKYCPEYFELKNYIIAIINGDVTNYNLEKLEAQIYELYNSGRIQATQYDDLMRNFEEI